MKASRKNESLGVRCTGRQSKRRWRNIHLPVTNHNIAVGTKALHILVLVDVGVISVKEVAVAHHQVKHWVRIAVRLRGVATENVEYGPSVVAAGRNLAVAVVVGFTSRVCKALHFETDQSKRPIGSQGSCFVHRLRTSNPFHEAVP